MAPIDTPPAGISLAHGHARRLRRRLGGLVIPFMRPLYDYAWFVGFAVAFGVYLTLTSLRRSTP